MKNTVCYLFGFLVEAIILWQYSSSLFSAKNRARTRFIVLCGLYFIMFFVSQYEFIWLNTALYFALNLIFLVTQYDLNFYTGLFHSSTLTAVMGVSELIAYGITKYFAPHFLENGRKFIPLFIFSVFSKLIFFSVIYILTHLMQNHEKSRKQYDKSAFLLVFIPLTSVFIMHIFVIIGEAFSLSSSLDWMVTAGAVFLLISNLLMFGINQYHQKKNEEFTQMQLLLQQESDSTEYYEMLRLQNENQRILIHDIKKHLQSVAMLNERKEHDKIEAYIRQLILSSDLKEVSRLCEHELLNSILCRYMQQCTKNHITFHADIRSGTTDFIADNDLTSLFCNLLDNAMEAAGIVPDSFIEINTGRREKTPFVVITVINSCRTNPFLDKAGLLCTKKSDKSRHGFGLKSIYRTVKKYNGDMQMYYNDDTFTFHTIITLKQ
ncbi:MAG: GHKL domain-containing protein [Lachnospiraceae bacterium]|nr:GHKL domain-containing protein [Lachnospiraceae bacterium]